MTNNYKHHVSPAQMDAMDYNNPTSLHIMTDSVEGYVKELGLFYSKNISKDTQMAIAKRLVTSGYKVTAIKKGLEKVIDSCQSFPSYAEMVAHIRPFNPQIETNSYGDKEFEKEETKLTMIKAEFDKIIGLDGLGQYLRWWIKHVMQLPNDQGYIENMSFSKCALFDWYDAGMTRDFERIKAVGLAKIERIKNKNK